MAARAVPETAYARRPSALYSAAGVGGGRIAPSARASSRSAPRRCTTARTTPGPSATGAACANAV